MLQSETGTQNCHADTVQSVGRHFRLDPHGDLLMIPIEIVSPRDPFLLRARESYNIYISIISSCNECISDLKMEVDVNLRNI